MRLSMYKPMYQSFQNEGSGVYLNLRYLLTTEGQFERFRVRNAVPS